MAIAGTDLDRGIFMKNALVVVALLVAAAGGYWAGCGSRTRNVLDSNAEGAVIARFGAHALHAGEFEARLRATPEVAKERLASPEGRKQLVEEMVRQQLLAHRAEEKGYQRDPEFAKRYAEELGAFFLEKEFEEPERRRAPTDEELRKYFDAHQAEMSRPERVRIALIAFKVTSPEQREKKRALARATLSQAKAKAKDYYAFGSLARARSEDERTRASSGELGYTSRDDLTVGYGPELAQAAFEMRNANEIRGSVVEAPNALYVVKLVGREAAYEPRFEMVRDVLRGRLTNERRNADRKQFLDDLWKQADVKIDEDALKNLKLTSPGRT